MADPAAEARIRDLKRRLELDPGSRLFVALAEEYRKTGRLAEALSTLQRGLLAHPGYLSAHVALGRAYLEAGQITEAIAAFSKVLAQDPGNLVSARSLADIYLSRGESVEAVKKYKLYRALSGDPSVDDIVERLEMNLAPPPPPPAEEPPPPPPPPTFFEQKAPARPSWAPRERKPGGPAPSPSETFDMTSVKFEPEEFFSQAIGEPEPFAVVSRDVPLFAPPKVSAVAPPAPEDVATRAFRISEILGQPAPAAPPVEPAASPDEVAEPVSEATIEPAGPVPADAEPQGRVLADLYFAQGHYAEALGIYDELVAINPFDAELKRLRRDAEARLLPAGVTGAAAPDRALERRLAQIRVLKRWLSVVQTG